MRRLPTAAEARAAIWGGVTVLVERRLVSQVREGRRITWTARIGVASDGTLRAGISSGLEGAEAAHALSYRGSDEERAVAIMNDSLAHMGRAREPLSPATPGDAWPFALADVRASLAAPPLTPVATPPPGRVATLWSSLGAPRRRPPTAQH